MCFKACVIRSMGTSQLLGKYPSPALVLSSLASFLFLLLFELSFRHVNLTSEDEQTCMKKIESFLCLKINFINEMSLTKSQIVVNQMCAIMIVCLKPVHWL